METCCGKQTGRGGGGEGVQNEEWTGGPIYRRANRWTDGTMDGHKRPTDRPMDGRRDGHEWINIVLHKLATNSKTEIFISR